MLNFFQYAEQELHEIVAPLAVIKAKLTDFIQRQDAQIAEHAENINLAQLAIEMHRTEKEQANKVLSNVSALLQ